VEKVEVQGMPIIERDVYRLRSKVTMRMKRGKMLPRTMLQRPKNIDVTQSPLGLLKRELQLEKEDKPKNNQRRPRLRRSF